MISPFCRQSDLLGNIRKEVLVIPEKSVFEIDDRSEGVFDDMDSLRIPMYGQLSKQCGFIQQDSRGSCVYCGTIINETIH